MILKAETLSSDRSKDCTRPGCGTSVIPDQRESRDEWTCMLQVVRDDCMIVLKVEKMAGEMEEALWEQWAGIGRPPA